MATADEILAKYGVSEEQSINTPADTTADDILTKYGIEDTNNIQISSDHKKFLTGLEEKVAESRAYENTGLGKILTKTNQVVGAPVRFLTGRKYVTPTEEAENQLKVAREAASKGDSPVTALFMSGTKEALKESATALPYMVSPQAGLGARLAIKTATYGAKPLVEEFDSKDVSKSLYTATKKGLQSAVTDELIGGAVGKVVKPVSSAIASLFPPKLTRRAFREMTDNMKIPGEISDNMLNNSDDIIARKTQLTDPEYLPKLAKQIQTNIGAKKTTIGKKLGELKMNLPTNKYSDVDDLVQVLDRNINSGILPSQEIEALNEAKNLLLDASTKKGVSYRKLAQLNSELNNMTHTKSGKEVVGQAQSIIGKMKQSLANKIQSPAYQKAMAEYAELSAFTSNTFDPTVFRNANLKDDKTTYLKILGTLKSVGKESGGTVALTPKAKEGLVKQANKILPKAGDIYKEALNHNTANTFFRKYPTGTKPGETSLAGLWINRVFLPNVISGLGTTKALSPLMEKIVEPATSAAGGILRRKVSQELGNL